MYLEPAFDTSEINSKSIDWLFDQIPITKENLNSTIPSLKSFFLQEYVGKVAAEVGCREIDFLTTAHLKMVFLKYF